MTTVTAARAGVPVRCGSCGGTRMVSREQASRIRNGRASGLCRTCRRPEARARAAVEVQRSTDAGMRWWIRRFGGTIGHGQDPREFIRTTPLPAELTELLASLR